jgi:hypothetical protein
MSKQSTIYPREALRATIAESASANASVQLGRVTVEVAGIRRRGSAILRFGLHPNVEIKVVGLRHISGLKGRVTVSGFRPTVAAMPWHLRNGVTTVRIQVLGELVSSSRPRRVKFVDFVLANLFEFHGNRIVRRGTSRGWQRVEQTLGPFTLILDELGHAGSHVEQLQIQGGYAITHAARLMRTDGASLSLKEAIKTLDAIGWYLTFARGAHVHPMFVYAPSSTGPDCYRDWSVNRCDPWASRRTWFDPRWSAKLFIDALPGFLQSYKQHGNALRLALDWYIHARAAHVVDARTIFAVAGLEVIATIVVAGSFSGAAVSAFEKTHHKAAHKIAAMLAAMGATTAIPKSLRRLTAWAKANNVEGAWALTRLRNIVHANQISRVVAHGRMIRTEASELALFWFEAAVLHLCGVPFSRLSGRTAPSGGRWSVWAKRRK